MRGIPSCRGFTLVELMVVLAVVAILLGVAGPYFTEYIKNNRISGQSNSFHSALMLARSEALARITRVTACSSSNGTSCASGGWEQGWIVFVDSDNDAVVDGGETILRVDQVLTGGNTLRGESSVASYVSYVGDGSTMTTGGGIQAGTLVVCDDRGFTSDARAIIISATGRARVTDATDSSLSSCTP